MSHILRVAYSLGVCFLLVHGAIDFDDLLIFYCIGRLCQSSTVRCIAAPAPLLASPLGASGVRCYKSSNFNVIYPPDFLVHRSYVNLKWILCEVRLTDILFLIRHSVSISDSVSPPQRTATPQSLSVPKEISLQLSTVLLRSSNIATIGASGIIRSLSLSTQHSTDHSCFSP